MDWTNWVDYLVLAALLVTGLAGIALTAVTLPGTWLNVLVGIGVAVLKPELISWWAVGACALLALLGEIVELVASAVGAAKGGASKKGALGALLGSILGAILGAPFLFPLGSIGGAAVGAGLGAMVAERGIAGKTWSASAKAGGGAAAGRLVAVALKTSIAAVIALLLVAAVFIPGF